MKEKLDIAFRSKERRGHPSYYGGTIGLESSRDVAQDTGPNLGILYHALALGDNGAARLELGSTSTTRFRTRLGEGDQRRCHHHERNKRQIGHHHVELAASEVSRPQVAYVGPLHDLYAWVPAEPLEQLAVPDVNGDNVSRPVGEQAVCEPTRRGPSVEGRKANDVELEMMDGGIQLLAAAGLAKRGGRSLTTSGSDGATWRDTLSATAPATSTRPALTSAAASARLGASPRATSSISSLFLAPSSGPSSA